MSGFGFTLFDTPIGRCAAAWSPRGLCATALPGGSEDAMARRMAARIGDPGLQPTPPPKSVREALDGMAAHLEGRLDELAWIVLDHAGAPGLHQRIWARVRAIPPGSTLTYGQVAADLGDRSLAQAVGQAMARNPTPIVVPCHRVLGSGGKAGGFSAPGGVGTKFHILQIEGARMDDHAQRGLFDALPLQARS